MVRMLHFADFHLGMENYGRDRAGINSRIYDFCDRLDEMVSFSTREDIDLVLFAGDAFKNRQPNPTLQREFAARIMDMASRCPVVMLVGNHDMPTHELRASSLEIYQTLNVPNVLIGSEYDLYEVPTPKGSVFVGTAPYPMRQNLLKDEELHGKSISELDDLLLNALIGELDRLARRAAAAQPEDAPRVLAAHFSVSGAQWGSERGVTIGRDPVVPLGSLDDSAWDYVALGHIHKHQNLTQGRKGAPPVVYSGSMERIDFGEEGDPKGFCVVDLSRHDTQWRFWSLNSRPFMTVRVDVRGDLDPMDRILSTIRGCDLQGAVVRVILQADPENSPLIKEDAIHKVLDEAKVHTIAAVIKEVNQASRARLGESPEGLTPLELLERFFNAKEYAPDRIESLLKYAEQFLHEDGG